MFTLADFSWKQNHPTNSNEEMQLLFTVLGRNLLNLLKYYNQVLI